MAVPATLFVFQASEHGHWPVYLRPGTDYEYAMEWADGQEALALLHSLMATTLGSMFSSIRLKGALDVTYRAREGRLLLSLIIARSKDSSRRQYLTKYGECHS